MEDKDKEVSPPPYKVPSELFVEAMDALDKRRVSLLAARPLAYANFALIEPFIIEFTSPEARQARQGLFGYGYFSQYMSGDTPQYGLYGATPEFFDRVLEALTEYIEGSACDTRSQTVAFDIPGLRLTISTEMTEDDLFTLQSLGKIKTVQDTSTYQTVVCEVP